MDDKALIRIDSLLRHIDMVLSDMKDVSLDGFESNDLLFRATCFSIAQIGEQMTRLQEKIGEKCQYDVPVLAEESFVNEKNELMAINPQGERIYEAAFSGNTEAMRAVGYMYYHGEGVRQDNIKALKWFMKAADMNDEYAKNDAKLIGLEMGLIGSLIDQDLFYYCKKMKPGLEKERFMERLLTYNLADSKMERIREVVENNV